MYATAGNLDTYLITRAHFPNPTASDLTASGLADGESLGQLPREERIKAFKKRRQSSTGAGVGITGGRKKREETRGVLLLGVEEIGKLFGDVVEGLAFLVRLLIDPMSSTDDTSMRIRFSTSTSNARMSYFTGRRESSCMPTITSGRELIEDRKPFCPTLEQVKKCSKAAERGRDTRAPWRIW